MAESRCDGSNDDNTFPVSEVNAIQGTSNYRIREDVLRSFGCLCASFVVVEEPGVGWYWSSSLLDFSDEEKVDRESVPSAPWDDRFSISSYRRSCRFLFSSRFRFRPSFFAVTKSGPAMLQENTFTS